jgi:putative ATP-binding cassette transporter
VKLLALLRAESQLDARRLALLAAAAAVANVAILAIINAAAGLAARRDINLRLGLMFGIAIILYVLAQRALMSRAVAEIERIVHRVRVRLIAMLQRTDLTAFEHIGHAVIYAGITRETSTITQSAPALVTGAQSVVLILFASIYVASITFWGFLIGAAFMVLATLAQLRRMRHLGQQVHAAAVRENAMFEGLSDILKGFKEVQMSSRRAREIFADVSAASSEAADLRVKTQLQWVDEFVRIQVIFFLLPGTAVFLAPRFSTLASDDVIKMTAAIFFLIGPIGYVGQTIQVVTTLNVAAEHVFALQDLLAGAPQVERPAPARERLIRDFSEGFREVTLDGVVFQHRTDGTTGFAIGPVSLTIQAGEILFISGGNGSGKSTLVKVLAGLYRPSQGTLRVNGVALAPDEYQAYRDRLTVIFSDYHLFARLYGLDPPSSARARELLEDLGLQDKTRLAGDRFETLDLSFGQRKRLALMVALLEDQPLMIFDEWAAEQDPGFRARFYREILPALKRAGKTLVVVTHDDRYFDVADRHVRMEEGVIVSGSDGVKADR